MNRTETLDLLLNLPPGRFLIGQHLFEPITPARIRADYDHFINDLYQQSGQYPAVLGLGYGWGAALQDILDANAAYTIPWSQAGGCVTVDMLPRNPWTGGQCWDLSQRDLVDLLDPASQANANWMAFLDILVTALTQLRDRDIGVIFRPFPELSYTDTFWWDAGAHPNDPGPFVAMWQHLHDHLVNHAGLDNLLWCYCVANGGPPWCVPPLDLWPGDTYVDIAGVDCYRFDDPVKPVRNNIYSDLLSTGKPFAIPEAGASTPLDLPVLADMIVTLYPAAKFVQFWHSWTDSNGTLTVRAIVDHLNPAQFMNHSATVTRADLSQYRMQPSRVAAELRMETAQIRAALDDIDALADQVEQAHRLLQEARRML